MSDTEMLDAEILRHMQEFPRVSPARSLPLRRLASSISKDSIKVIDSRMKALRELGCYRWARKGSRYEVLTPQP